MATLSFYKVTSLPATLEPDALYFVKNADYAESYLTDSTGSATSIGNSVMIDNLIAEALGRYESGGLVIVSTITERDDLALGVNTLVLVIDATADPTVESGSALYAYNIATDEYIKVAEYESLDVIVQWTEIQGRPSSTPSEIDQAVADRHTHANLSTLNKITEEGGIPKWDGGQWPTEWSTSNW